MLLQSVSRHKPVASLEEHQRSDEAMDVANWVVGVLTFSAMVEILDQSQKRAGRGSCIFRYRGIEVQTTGKSSLRHEAG